jgi:hypothetical protein
MTEPTASHFEVGDQPHFPLHILRAMRAEVDVLVGFRASPANRHQTPAPRCSSQWTAGNVSRCPTPAPPPDGAEWIGIGGARLSLVCFVPHNWPRRRIGATRKLVGVAGFEPATPSSRTRCATSHTPISLELRGISAPAATASIMSGNSVTSCGSGGTRTHRRSASDRLWSASPPVVSLSVGPVGPRPDNLSTSMVL